MPIEPPRPRSGLRASSENQAGDLGWSDADELAALETVWDSLCQEAAMARLPVGAARVVRRDRCPGSGGRLAS